MGGHPTAHLDYSPSSRSAKMKFSSRRLLSVLLGIVLLFACPSRPRAADPAAALTVNRTATPLYSRQDEHSDVLTDLKNGESLLPVAEAIGTETWYLVQTREGLTGWVRGTDVSVSEKARETFREPAKEQNIAGSVWTAQDDKGRTFRGSWTVEATRFADKATGTWTLDNGAGASALHGTWSAQKFGTGWSGTWRALVDGQKTDYGGSWTTDLPKSPEPRISDLFEAAARDFVRGIWTSGTVSGSWSIRAAK